MRKSRDLNEKGGVDVSREWKLVILTGVLIMMAILAPQFLSGAGIVAENLELDARKVQKVPDDWVGITAIGDKLAGVLLYSPTLEDYTYALYTKREKESEGYFFHESGSSTAIKEGVQMFSHKDGSVILSMNQPAVEKVIWRDGETNTYYIADHQPFVLTLPKAKTKDATVQMYDRLGKEVPFHRVIEL